MSMPFSDLPDDKYIGLIQRIACRELKPGHKDIEWLIIVEESPSRYDSVLKLHDMTREKDRGSLARDLKRLGVTGYDNALDKHREWGRLVVGKRILFKASSEGWPPVQHYTILGLAVPGDPLYEEIVRMRSQVIEVAQDCGYESA